MGFQLPEVINESDDDDKANIGTSFVAFLYHEGEKNSNCKLNEPSQRAVVQAACYLH